RVEIKIGGHALPCAGRRVVEGEHALDPSGIVTLLRVAVPHAHGKSVSGALAIPDVTEIHLQLAREEELVRRRKNGKRTIFTFSNRNAIAVTQNHLFPRFSTGGC